MRRVSRTVAADGRPASRSAPFKKGVAYLLKTQQADGTWLVQSRAVPIQPLFDIGFPYGSRNAWVSAAGTNWAATALAIAARESAGR